MTVASGEPFVHRFPPRIDEIPVARHQLSAWLAERGVDNEVSDDFALAASELCTNAVEHGGPGLVVLRAWIDGPSLALEVEAPDWEGKRTEKVMAAGGPFAEGGRGMQIVRAACDELSISHTGGNRRVQCRRRLVAPD